MIGFGPVALKLVRGADFRQAVCLQTLHCGSSTVIHAVKFTVPTVAKGKVYVGTRANDTGGGYGSTSVSGELDAYELMPN